MAKLSSEQFDDLLASGDTHVVIPRSYSMRNPAQHSEQHMGTKQHKKKKGWFQKLVSKINSPDMPSNRQSRYQQPQYDNSAYDRPATKYESGYNEQRASEYTVTEQPSEVEYKMPNSQRYSTTTSMYGNNEVQSNLESKYELPRPPQMVDSRPDSGFSVQNMDQIFNDIVAVPAVSKPALPARNRASAIDLLTLKEDRSSFLFIDADLLKYSKRRSQTFEENVDSPTEVTPPPAPARRTLAKTPSPLVESVQLPIERPRSISPPPIVKPLSPRIAKKDDPLPLSPLERVSEKKKLRSSMAAGGRDKSRRVTFAESTVDPRIGELEDAVEKEKEKRIHAEKTLSESFTRFDHVVQQSK